MCIPLLEERETKDCGLNLLGLDVLPFQTLSSGEGGYRPSLLTNFNRVRPF
ncbi:hypothetical protein ACFOG5_16245 [Pedobacter fastidiosus]|uniref:hypothetical protein n=1 Tax=Pedobacter fastidiosus TaxID=2765361 RepID=UPI00361CA4DD